MRLNHPTGQAAEDKACAFLKKQGFKILQRNWHCAFGEIDIIATQKQLLLFVEVKYRKSAAFGGAAYSITPSKLLKLQRSVEFYLQQNPHKGDIRLDAILIEDKELSHIENILG
ncbi:MAG: YraN family protein [Neisseriaceae bacterium]|nr:YraN family protein [Neisseriaceae bacterium]MBQ9260148.1 YraN family protein [Neisseriaceae bacterium]MBQ9724032.1 YraN family protein [Neisseriaceae bacterium]MBR1818866.1 YraN family protein [Neisseriaceae bacterium]